MSKTLPFGSDLLPPTVPKRPEGAAAPPGARPAAPAPVAAPVPVPSPPSSPSSKPGSTPGSSPASMQLDASTELRKEGSLVGQRLRHFKVEKFIASGGMGEVYQGVDTALNRPVAIKTLNPSFARDKRFLGAFLMEAQAQANVFHPHVLQVYFVGADKNDLLFIAMQLVQGGSLQDRLDHGPPFSWQEAAKHMLGIADGLAEAARLGIVHRDIKPANILLDQFGEAHLSDFGLAMAGAEAPPIAGAISGEKRSPSGVAQSSPSGAFRPSHPGLSTPTRAGQVTGTLEYMPPEQARGEVVDQRADVYSLGATFFHLLTGHPPVQAATVADARRAHEGAPLPSVGKLAPHVPRELALVVDRCLARDKERRFQTAAELVAALRRAGPQPEVPAGVVLRLLSWLLEALPIAALLRFSYDATPWAAFAVFLLATAAGFVALRAPPGQWLMRLRLRTVGDGDVSPIRGLARFLLQNAWLLPFSYFLHAAFQGSTLTEPLGWASLATFSIPALGGLGALFGRRQTLPDFLTRTRVLVDMR
ncbi:MAG: protein kinase domain-containing protein [Deltaproteobacteria bacterium]